MGLKCIKIIIRLFDENDKLIARTHSFNNITAKVCYAKHAGCIKRMTCELLNKQVDVELENFEKVEQFGAIQVGAAEEYFLTLNQGEFYE